MTRSGGLTSCTTRIAPAFARTSLARANDGAPSVDGTTFEQIETTGLENWLSRLGEELRAQTYRCQPVRRVMIPKPGGGERPSVSQCHGLTGGSGGANRGETGAGANL
jgi:retron-type reverse transcriptase